MRMIRVGLVGQVNVGKSTLFNRLLGTFRAIVTDIPGTTRELLVEEAILQGRQYTLVDSPGLDNFQQELVFIDQIIASADLLLFVVDARRGPTAQDAMIKQHILRAGKQKQTILVANKLDQKVGTRQGTLLLAERFDRGFTPIFPLSAQQGDGIDTVQEHILSVLQRAPKEPKGRTEQAYIPLAIVGRPNTGKSTLLNTLLGDQLAEVSDKPGTTLDYIVGTFAFGGKQFRVYDTAGIRKKGRTVGIEKIAYEKTRSLLQYIKPVTILLVDLVEGLTQRDKTLIGELIDMKVPLIIACNKADTVQPHLAERLVKNMIITQPGRHWIHVHRISAKEGFNIPDLLRSVEKTYAEHGRRLATADLNDVISDAWIASPPRFPKNKICKIKYVTQVETAPPTFYVSVNNPDLANFAFTHWIENVIRKAYGFASVPLVLQFSGTAKANPYADRHGHDPDSVPVKGTVRRGRGQKVEKPLSRGTSQTPRGEESPSRTRPMRNARTEKPKKPSAVHRDKPARSARPSTRTSSSNTSAKKRTPTKRAR